MVGLVFLAIIGVYVLIVLGATLTAIYVAKRYEARPLIRGMAGLGGFLLVTLPIFWDWAPVVMAHNHYCAKDAGFFLYKSPEQWMKENPGVAETLTYKYISDAEKIDGGERYLLNQRIAREVRNSMRGWGIHQREELVVDQQSGQILALYRDFWTGVTASTVGNNQGLRAWKVWMKYDGCESGDPYYWKRSQEFSEVAKSYKRFGSSR